MIGDAVSQEDISRMMYEILIRFEEEVKEYEEKLKANKFSEFNVQARRRYYQQLYKRLSHTAIREVGEFIIKPYTADPQKPISQFLTEIDKAYFLGYRDNRLPDLSEFIIWYCDSDLIQKEVIEERTKRNNLLKLSPQ